MGFINIIKNGYTGKLGETVGANVNGTLILRTRPTHNNSNTPKQQAVKVNFSELLKEASAHYGNTLNISTPKGIRMNAFNFFASVYATGESNPEGGFTFFDLTPRTSPRMLSPYYFIIDNEYFMALRVSTFGNLLPEKTPKVIGFMPDGIKNDSAFEQVILRKQKTINATPQTDQALFLQDKTFFVQLPSPAKEIQPQHLGYFALNYKLNKTLVTTPCIKLAYGATYNSNDLVPN